MEGTQEPPGRLTLRWAPWGAAPLSLSWVLCLLGGSIRADSPELLRGHQETVFALAFSSDGRLLVSGSADQTLRLWRLDAVPDPSERAERLRPLIESLDDQRFDVRQRAHLHLASLGDEAAEALRAALQQTDSAEVRVRIRHLLAKLSIPPGVGHEGDVRSVAVSKDAQLIASAGRDSRVLLWSAKLGRVIRALEGHTDGVWAVAFSDHGSRLASGGGDQTIRIWNARDGSLNAVWEGHESTVQDLAFSPDGKLLASAGGFDNSVRLWEVDGGGIRAVLRAHTDAVLSVAFSPDGRWLASGGYGSKVRVWRMRDLQLEHTLDTEQRVVRSLDFSPDSRVLAVAGDGGSLGLWDVPAGRRITGFPVRGEPLYCVRFSPGGTSLAAGGGDGDVRWWEWSSSGIKYDNPN